MNNNKLIVGLATGSLLFGMVGIANAGAIDLSSWTADTYDLTGGQPPGDWVLSNNNETVTQILNADPSVYLNGVSQTSYEMDGHWKVDTGSDDDFMGFVFGYQNDHQFYVMDWKQSYQAEGGDYGTASAGFRILKIDASSRSDLVLRDFWESDTANSTVLASSYGTGWSDYQDYGFHLDFTANGEFSVEIFDGTDGTIMWDVTVNDDSYSYGQFGFYNFSQENVEYSGFEQTGGVVVDPVPEPATMLLFGTGLVGLVGVRLRKKKK